MTGTPEAGAEMAVTSWPDDNAVIEVAFARWNKGICSKGYDDRERGFTAGYRAARLASPAPSDALLTLADEAVTWALDSFGGYCCDPVDKGIAYMQARGKDRWSMQAQMDGAKCFACGGSGQERTLGRDNSEEVGPCSVCQPAPSDAGAGAVVGEALTPAQLDAIVDALNFCLADDWDESSHEHGPAVYERALEKVQSLKGRVLKGSLRVALDEANAAFHASYRLARNAEAHCTELRAKITELEALAALPPAAGAFQARVQPWLMACFGEMIAGDREGRNHRFLEEALELVQSCGCTASEAHQLVDYVYGRQVGEPSQEVGGVMVTLAALCLANGLDMHADAENELARIWTKIEAISAKQAAKPKHSPLPQHVATPPGQPETRRDALTRMVAMDEAMEAEHPGWMTGQPEPRDRSAMGEE